MPIDEEQKERHQRHLEKIRERIKTAPQETIIYNMRYLAEMVLMEYLLGEAGEERDFLIQSYMEEIMLWGTEYGYDGEKLKKNLPKQTKRD